VTGFQDRLSLAEPVEKAIMDRLNSSGWAAFPFGQAQLPPACRDRLPKFRDNSGRSALVRWMPDIITYTDLANGRSYVALIDAKATRQEHKYNYSLEMSAVETCEKWVDEFFTPTFFVFDDFRVLTPREARQRGTPGQRRDQTAGSGTPFFLVPKIYAKPFDEFFPPRLRASAA
jgi:hypothetical protein